MARTSKKASVRHAAASGKSHSAHSASGAHSKASSSHSRSKRSKADSSKDDDSDRVKTTRRKASSSRSKSKHGKASSRDRESDNDSERSVSVAKVRKSVRHRSESASQEDDSEPQPKPVVVRRARGQQGIDGGRAREIQEALIREHYLDGEATGVWDSRSRQAMMRYQNDNGWQTRIIPDSRALIKLGLGPKHSGLLNPESVSDSIPDTAREMRPGGSTPR